MLKPPLQPMLLDSIKEPFDSGNYLFEFKWDGFRTLIFIENNEVYLQSRNQKDLTPYFNELTQITSCLNTENLVLDGEICYISPEGKITFNILQKRIRTKNNKQISKKYPVTLIVWDILSINKSDIYQLPLIKRKQHLNKIIAEENSLFQLSPYTITRGKKLYSQAEKNNLEGIVAKKLDSCYEFKRSHKWLKIKIWQYTTVFIGGYTRNKTALLVGKFLDKNLTYMGKIKPSLGHEEKTALFRFLLSLKQKKAPFTSYNGKNNVIWVKPSVRCRVKYTEITSHNTFRHGYAIKLEL